VIERLSPAFGRNDIVELVSRHGTASCFNGLNRVPDVVLPAWLWDEARAAGFDMHNYRRRNDGAEVMIVGLTA
jgi:hypothetical protein